MAIINSWGSGRRRPTPLERKNEGHKHIQRKFDQIKRGSFPPRGGALPLFTGGL